MSGWPRDMNWWREERVNKAIERDYGACSGESEVIAEEAFAAPCQACADEAEWEKEEGK